MNIIKNKKIWIIIAIVIIAFFAYKYFIKKDTNSSLTASVVSISPDNQFAAGREILLLLSDLESLQLNDDIFSDPVFKSLEDFSLPIEDEPKGRTNPFSPVTDEVNDATVNKESIPGS